MTEMPKPSFDLSCLDDLLASIRQAQEDADRDWFTTRDLAAWSGKSRNWCQEQLRTLVMAGRLEYIGDRRMRNILNNRMGLVPAYRVREQQEPLRAG